MLADVKAAGSGTFLVALATLGILVGGLVGLLGCGGGNDNTSPSSNGDSTNRYMSVDIETLIADYQESAALADAKYKDKRIVISGTKTYVEPDHSYVILEDFVRAEIRNPQLSTEVIVCFDVITVNGLCKGLSEGLVLLEDCFIKDTM